MEFFDFHFMTSNTPSSWSLCDTGSPCLLWKLDMQRKMKIFLGLWYQAWHFSYLMEFLDTVILKMGNSVQMRYLHVQFFIFFTYRRKTMFPHPC